MNRNTIFEFLRNNTELELRYMKVSKGSYPVLKIPYKWDTSYLIINSWRITDFQALILFSRELVVRFGQYMDCQINIPYNEIEYLEVHNELQIGYEALHDGKKVWRN